MTLNALFAEAELDPHIPALDLHGSSVVEAHYVVDLFLDKAFCSGERVVKIIHGKGSGTLRDGIIKFLKRHAQVAGHHQSLNEGEQGGVVYVALKPRV